MEEKTKSRVENPVLKANIFSRLFYCWIHPLLLTGFKRNVEFDDLYDTLPSDKADVLYGKLHEAWEKELDDAKEQDRKPQLIRALIRAHGKQYILCGFFSLFEECVIHIAQPLMLGQLLKYFRGDGSIEKWEAFCYATGINCCLAYTAIAHHTHFQILIHCGMKARVACTSLVYNKALKLSTGALAKATIGQMVNLISNDLNRFDYGTFALHYLWVGPVQTIIILAILLNVLGPSCLAGLVLLIIYIPFQAFIGKIFLKIRSKTAIRTDGRVRLMNEIVTGIRVIKMYAWEFAFAKFVEEKRKEEISVIKRRALFNTLNQSLFQTSMKIVLLATFASYVLTGNIMKADTVFVALALFNNLRITMIMLFPVGISQFAELVVSLKRLQDFLLLEEKQNAIKPESTEKSSEESRRIELKNVTAKWNEENHNPVLKDISFTADYGKLLAIIGPVGCGKSSLLQVILRELPLSAGTVTTQGRIAYAAQEPWIFSGSIKDNILCGQKHNHARYRQVIKVCALDKDLTLFPHGDATQVGEKGVALSGGQKARVNLARALYVEADIYLLDDPLSAVDVHVGKHLFDQSIVHFLRGKIRILVTHQLQYLQDADKIVLLKDGAIDKIGSYSELINQGADLAQLVPRSQDEEELPEDEVLLHGRNSRSPSQISKRSCTSVAETKKPQVPATEVSKETAAIGNVTKKTYWAYFRTGSNSMLLWFIVFVNILSQISYNGVDYWLSYWTNSEEKMSNLVTHNSSDHLKSTYVFDSNQGIYVYAILVLAVFVLTFARTYLVLVSCIRSSQKLHDNMFTRLIRTPIRFFDTNSVGRVLNRFTKDMGIADELLPFTIEEALTLTLMQVGSITLVGVINPWLFLPIVMVGCVFVAMQKFYLATARDIKRIESNTRSPVFAHLSTTLVGVTTIRAHGIEPIFREEFYNTVNNHSSAWYLYLCTSRWLGVWLESSGLVYLSCVTYGVLALENSISGSDAGLIISSSLSVGLLLQRAVRQLAEVENMMTAVERLLEYTKLPSEASVESSDCLDQIVEAKWPSKGEIEFRNVFLRYDPSESFVLKGITFKLEARQKVGVVGRTGAGKSSIIAALFRMAQPEGSIFIDGVDTKFVPLAKLRSSISIIPQDPVLFIGTLRRNLDPFGDYMDDALWKALEEVKLKEVAASVPEGLDMQVSEGGSNFSVGQRQLICLARALLKGSRILILDEATASVDHRTDAFIQQTIREKCADCTVLTIAHRLNTIIDSDKIMVLDAGILQEFDQPLKLLENKHGLLYSLVQQTGETSSEYLYEVAKKAADTKLEPERGVITREGDSQEKYQTDGN